jgi:hypothetical protein
MKEPATYPDRPQEGFVGVDGAHTMSSVAKARRLC